MGVGGAFTHANNYKFQAGVAVTMSAIIPGKC